MTEKRDIIIDNETAYLLTQIAGAEEDAETLIRIASVIPNQFKIFLEETGEINNPYAQTLLNAALRLNVRGAELTALEEQLFANLGECLYSFNAIPMRDIVKTKIDMILSLSQRQNWLTRGAEDRTKDAYHLAIENSCSLNNEPFLSLGNLLEQLTRHQAYIFWVSRGAICDNDHNRMLNDYFDAKRYIGFLFADNILEDSMNNTSHVNCQIHLKEEYLDYLASLSVGEYLRIKAYFIWENKSNVKIDNDTKRIDSDYFEALDYLRNAMWHCMDITPDHFTGECINIDILRKHFSNVDPEAIKIAKINTGRRLQINTPANAYEFVDIFYGILSKALENKPIHEEDAIYVLGLMYKNYHIINMLEFILGCFLCAYLERKPSTI